MSGLEIAAALGFACNIPQLIEQGLKLVNCVKEVAELGTTQANDELQSGFSRLDTALDTLEAFRTSPQLHTLGPSQADGQLFAVAAAFKEASDDLFQHLAQLRSKNGPDWLKTLKTTSKSLWHHSKTLELVQKLTLQQDIPQTTALLSTREQTYALAADLRSRCELHQEEIKRASAQISIVTQSLASEFQAVKDQADRNTDRVLNGMKDLQQLHISQAEAQIDSVAVKQLLDSLRWTGMSSRLQQVEERPAVEVSDGARDPWKHLEKWQQSGENSFWVHGKAGSGKSTLMRQFIRRLESLSRNKQSPGMAKPIILEHLFWLAGASLQKNFCGMLSTILLQALKQNKDTARQLLALLPALQDMTTFGDWRQDTLEDTLRRVLRDLMIVSEIYIFLDGLDEVQDRDTIQPQPDKALVEQWLSSVMGAGRIRFCVSSRYEEPWTELYRDKDQLILHKLNTPTIKAYVAREISKNERITQLLRANGAIQLC